MDTLTFLLTSSFYPPYHIGGDALHVSYLAEELAKRGHEVHVLHSLDAYRAKTRQVKDQVQSTAVITHPIETTLSRSAYEAYFFGGSRAITGRFRRLINKVKPDVVHHHNISLLGHNILRKCGDYLNLYTAHDYWLICPQNNLLRRSGEVCETASCTFCGLAYRRPPQLWRRLTRFKKSIESIDFLIAPSRYVEERMTKQLPVKTVTITNFVPKPPERIPSSGFSDFILYAGTLEKHKGILPLLAAWKGLLNESGSKALFVAGDGPLRGEVRRVLGKYGLERLVAPLGWLDHSRLWPLLADARALIVPSLCPETSSLVSMEAFSVGTPVIGSSRGGLPEIVSRLDGRLVFSWEEKNDLSRAFGVMKENYETLRKNASQTYQQYFSPDSYLTSYTELLRCRLGPS
jgi:glycosyltransferase involved in cell wall biosynthesis